MLLEGWLAEDPTVVIQRVLMTIDKDCAVAIPSLVDEECLPQNNLTLPPIPQGESITGTIAGTMVAGGALVILIGISILITVCTAKKQRKR